MNNKILPAINLFRSSLSKSGYVDIAGSQQLHVRFDANSDFVVGITFPEIAISEIGFSRLVNKWFSDTKNNKGLNRLIELKDTVHFVFAEDMRYTNFITETIKSGSDDWQLCTKFSQWMDAELEILFNQGVKMINQFILNTTVDQEVKPIKNHSLTGTRLDVSVVSCTGVLGLSDKELSMLCGLKPTRLLCVDIEVKYWGASRISDDDYQIRKILCRTGSSYVDIVSASMSVIRDSLHSMVLHERKLDGRERSGIKESVEDDLKAWIGLNI
ncbi:hypothetical protein [Photobacterium damselae]|uniref:hypothetical protein n=1 Tax=Photobacterium damselae TaxID=38293 RepID=UPI001EE0EC0C|nr:hypothetical protein [Photobacterium damselae]MCG3823465.1 hypothetical protein [Photobacterium damselae]